MSPNTKIKNAMQELDFMLADMLSGLKRSREECGEPFMRQELDKVKRKIEELSIAAADAFVYAESIC